MDEKVGFMNPFLSKEDAKRLLELLNETERILIENPPDLKERLRDIHVELVEIRKKSTQKGENVAN